MHSVSQQILLSIYHTVGRVLGTENAAIEGTKTSAQRAYTLVRGKKVSEAITAGTWCINTEQRHREQWGSS